jgi:hypothetical protein
LVIFFVFLIGLLREIWVRFVSHFSDGVLVNVELFGPVV